MGEKRVISMVGKFLHYAQRTLKSRVDRKQFRKLFPEHDVALPKLELTSKELKPATVKALFMSEKGVDIEKAEATFEEVYKIMALELKDRVLLSPKSKIMGRWRRHRGSLESALPMQRMSASALKRMREERRKQNGGYERRHVNSPKHQTKRERKRRK